MGVDDDCETHLGEEVIYVLRRSPDRAAPRCLVAPLARRWPHAEDQAGCVGVPGRQAHGGHRRLEDAGGHGGNVVYKRLRERGYEVFAVNPNADEVEGDRCYHDLRSIPGGVDGVVIATRPETAEATMRECAELGIKHVWMHKGPGAGQRLADGHRVRPEHGITVIDGGCPCMFGPTADRGHKAMRVVLTLTGSVPRRIE